MPHSPNINGGVSINYYNEIKNNFIDEEIYSKVKNYSKEKHRVETYYKNGKLLNEAESHYGEWNNKRIF